MSGTGAYGILQAAGLLFFAFAGYARIATLGEEVVEPKRTIPLTRSDVAENGTVVVEYHARGVTNKDREYDAIYYYVVDVVDGKIKAVRQSLDTQYAHRVLYS